MFQSFNLLLRETAHRKCHISPALCRPAKNVWLADARHWRPWDSPIGWTIGQANSPAASSNVWRSRATIVKQPDLILADEPTGNLDSAVGRQIMELFESVHQQGMTIVLITHNPEIARLGDRTCAPARRADRADGAKSAGDPIPPM